MPPTDTVTKRGRGALEVTPAQKGNHLRRNDAKCEKINYFYESCPREQQHGKVVEEVRAGWHTVALDVFIQ